MRTLLSSQRPLLLFENPYYVWNPRSTFTQQQQNPTKLNLHANAKGFGDRSTSPPTSLNKSASDSNNNNNKNKKGSSSSSSSKSNNNNKGENQLPQVVLDRIIVRMLVSVGVPLVTGVASLHFYGIVKENRLFDLPLWIPLLTTFLTFGFSAAGVAYGPISTSWDAEKKGSLLGFEEAKQNWVDIWTEDDDADALK